MFRRPLNQIFFKFGLTYINSLADLTGSFLLGLLTTVRGNRLA